MTVSGQREKQKQTGEELQIIFILNPHGLIQQDQISTYLVISAA